jgi:hypothetical protein
MLEEYQRDPSGLLHRSGVQQNERTLSLAALWLGHPVSLVMRDDQIHENPVLSRRLIHG